jgi:hypothetical protein
MDRRIEMKITSVILFCIVTAVTIATIITCSDDKSVTPEPLNPPPDLIGIPGGYPDIGEGGFLLIWNAPDGRVDGYKVYRRIEDGRAERLNDELISERPFGPGSTPPELLFFIDSTISLDAALEHQYFVTSVRGVLESQPSNEVACTPALVYPLTMGTIESPDEEIDVSISPSFQWEAGEPPSRYLIQLREGGQDSSVVWLASTGSFQASLGDSGLVTYIAPDSDSLEFGTDYHWSLMTLADDVLGVSFAEASFTTIEHRLVARLIYAIEDGGVYRLCWDQQDRDGAIVSPGIYRISMIAGGYENDSLIQIDQSFPHINSPNCNHGSGGGIPPATYWMTVNSDVLGVGDTLGVTYWLPQESDVNVAVYRYAK